MKKETKKKIKKALSEGITEIVLSVIFLLSGGIVASLLGICTNKNVDFSILILIGIAVLLVAFGLIYVLKIITKKRHEKSDEINDIPEE